MQFYVVRIWLLCLVVCLAISTGLLGDELHEVRGETMGTTYSVKWVAPTFDAGLQTKIDDRLRAVNSAMSTYDPDSELSKFNDSRSTDWFDVSPSTATVVAAALNMSQISGGAFDPTVGRLVRMWSFGKDFTGNVIPSAEEIATALKSVGYQHVTARLYPPAIRKDQPEVELDLSAIAKGYGVDEVGQVLKDNGIEAFMVEIGGEVMTAGKKPDSPWRLGIQQPDTATGDLTATIELQDQALATSGDYRNYFEKDGVRYSHTIDPRNGFPITHQLASASVVANTCMEADAWATTLMVLGGQAGLELAEKHNISAFLLIRKGEAFEQLATTSAVGKFATLDESPVDSAPEGSLLSTFLITLAVFGIAIVLLATGVIFSNRTLKGSCGGLSGQTDESGRSICDLCTTPPEECDQVRERLRECATPEAASAAEKSSNSRV